MEKWCDALSMLGSLLQAAAATEEKTEAGNTSTATEEADAGAVDNSEFVELNFYISNSPVTDQERMMEKANAIIKDNINAKLNLNCVDPGTYASQTYARIPEGLWQRVTVDGKIMASVNYQQYGVAAQRLYGTYGSGGGSWL